MINNLPAQFISLDVCVNVLTSNHFVADFITQLTIAGFITDGFITDGFVTDRLATIGLL